MEMKKCSKCGAFVETTSDLCSTCTNQIAYENTVLKNYFDENSNFDSIPSISAITGIAPNTIQNYMKTNYINSDIDITSSFNSIQY